MIFATSPYTFINTVRAIRIRSMRGEPKEGARVEISCAGAAKNRSVCGCCGIIGGRAGGGSFCLLVPKGIAGKKSESIYSNPVPALAATGKLRNASAPSRFR